MDIKCDRCADSGVIGSERFGYRGCPCGAVPKCYRHPEKPATHVSTAWSLTSVLPVCELCSLLHGSTAGADTVQRLTTMAAE